MSLRGQKVHDKISGKKFQITSIVNVTYRTNRSYTGMNIFQFNLKGVFSNDKFVGLSETNICQNF